MNSKPGNRRVWLVRHAKAADPEPGQPDRERPLKNKGLKQCRQLADWLSERIGDAKVRALVSPATRTRQTADCALDGWFAGERQEEARIYEATPGTLTELLEEHSGNLVLIGHNPGLEQLQALLTGQVVPLPTGSAFEVAFADGGGCYLEARFQPE